MTFGQRLKRLREQRHLSREKIAEDLQLSYWAISKYETDKRSPDHTTLQRLANYFEVSLDELLGGNPFQKLEDSKPKDLEKFLDNQEIMFDGIPLTEDDKAKIRKSLEIIFWDAREKNKKARAEAKARKENENYDRS